MNEKCGGSNNFGSEQRTDGQSSVASAQQELKGYQERGVIDMIGAAWVKVADAYERRAKITESPDDLIQEITCRLVAATHLSNDESKMYAAWEQREHAITDLLDDDGRSRLDFANHPKITDIDVETVKKSMRDFEVWAGSARTSFGPLRYNLDLIKKVSLSNKRLGIR